MSLETIAGVEIALNEEGFVIDPNQWNEDVAVELARREGIDPLTDRHWEVIRFMRHEYETKGSGPSVRILGKTSGVSIKELYQLFPKGPAKLAAKIAGIPKPRGCI
jgi:tRNA 2-thiouridine synthesizing protein E